MQRSGQKSAEIVPSGNERTDRRDPPVGVAQHDEPYFRLLVEAAPQAIVEHDPSGIIRYASPAFEHLLGFTANEATGKALWELADREADRQKLRDRLVCLMQDASQPTPYCVSLIGKQGNVVEVQVNWNPTRDANGDLTSCVAVVSDVTSRRREHRESLLLPTLVQNIAESNDFCSALRMILQKLYAITGWHYGELWMPSEDDNTLRCVETIHDGSESLTAFQRASEAFKFVYGEGLPGRVWSLRQSEWIPDVSNASEQVFFREKLALKAGLEAGQGVPIVAGGEVLAVLVFFMREPREKDKRLVELVSAVAAQLGVHMERKQIEIALQRARDELERRVEERTVQLTEINIRLHGEIEDRKRVETALRQSEERFDMAVRGTSDGIWDHDIATGREYWSPRLYDLLGYDNGEIEATYETFVSLLHENDQEKTQQALRRHYDEDEPYDAEFRFRTKNGDYRWFQSRGQLIRDDAGRPIRMAGSIRDITQRKNAEEELRLSAEIIENMAEGVNLIRFSDATIVFTNPRFEQIFGYGPGELIGKHVSVLNASGEHTPDETVAEIIRGVAENGYWSGEIHNVRKNGTPFWTQTHVSAFDHPRHGTVYVSVQEDFTDRKQAAEALASSEKRLRDILDSMFAFVGLYTTDGILIEANRAPLEAAGIERADVIGKPLWETYWWSYSTDVQQQLKRALRRAAEGETVRYDVPVRVAGGEFITIDITFGPLYDSAGRVVQLIGSAVDITGRKQAEQALRDLNESLERRIAQRTADLVEVNESLRESEVRQRALLDAMPDMMFRFDLNSVFLDFRAEREQLLMKPQQIIGSNMRDSPMPPDVVERILQSGRRALETGATQAIEYALAVGDRVRHYEARIVKSGEGELVSIVRDVTRRKKLEKEVLQIAGREQRRIGRDLHDGVGQELTGLSLMTRSLVEGLQSDDRPERQDAARVDRGIRRVLEQIRSLSQGLVPVEVDARGLMVALEKLAGRTDVLSDVRCDFRCTQPIQITDNATATHLYLIAQEATVNALKHGRAKHIEMVLEAGDDRMILTICDNGIGFDHQRRESDGLGLRIMQYRAGLIGASLTITSAADGGTEVTCSLARGCDDRM